MRKGITNMSFLADLIGKVRLEFRSDSRNLKQAVTLFKEKVTQCLIALDKEGNLRVFDGEDGGVIRGPKRSRANRENKQTGSLLCQERYLDDDKLEVPYFKAVFNLTDHSFVIKETNSKVHLIGYESPLMRKRNENTNPGISSRAISCDLVGLTSDQRVLCIEGKVKPHNASTDIVYGILESLAYGVCVDYFISERNMDSFTKEVQGCAKEFHTDIQGICWKKMTAAFSLAAPKYYFSEFISPQHQTPKKAEKRLDEASQLVDVLCELDGPKWEGFLILEPPCCVSSFKKCGHRELERMKLIEPHFASGAFGISLAKDTVELKKILSFQGVET